MPPITFATLNETAKGRHDRKGKRTGRTALSLNLPISASAVCCARTTRPVQIHGHRRIEAPRNRFGRTFRLKLGRKAARGLGLGGSAAAIYSHSQERRDFFSLAHALSLGGPAARSIRANGLRLLDGD
jgi:hypothetical protein